MLGAVVVCTAAGRRPTLDVDLGKSAAAQWRCVSDAAGRPTRIAEERPVAQDRHALGAKLRLSTDQGNGSIADARHFGSSHYGETVHRVVGGAARDDDD